MQRTVACGIFILTSILGSGCSSDDAGGTNDEGGALQTPPADRGLQLEQAFSALAPGREVHYCQYYVLPDHPVDVARFQHTYTSGGHHVILYPTKLAAEDVQDRLDVFDCDEKAPNRGESGFAYVGGGTAGEVSYPDGVAWHFEPGAVVMLESHMLNLGKTPLDVDYRLNLWYAQSPVRDHVGTIFFYDNNIYIPAGGTYTARMDCGIPADINVLSLAPHMHVRGTRFVSELAGPGLDAPRPLVSSTDWSSVEATAYDPPLIMKRGQRVRHRCDYRNRDAFPAVERPAKAGNEMCLLIGSYYPKLDFPFEFCMLKGSGPVFDGSKTCAQAAACFTRTNDPIAAEQCRVDTCAKSSQAFDDLFSCTALNCFFQGRCQGTAANPDCQSCAIERCPNELKTCAAATCD